MLVQDGTGIRFAGDSMERFHQGDLVFYGTNLPHLYRSDKEYYQQKDPALRAQAMVVYFKENFLGESFWKLPDVSSFKKLFMLSKRGMKFKGRSKLELISHIQQLDEKKDGIGKIIDLLTILKIMASTNEYDLLSSSAFTAYGDDDDCERINKIYQYILDNYASNPTLEEVSKLAFMSETAFCRYFKSRTNKTYIQFLNEIKIGNACKMLIDNKFNISQVCYQIGFNNFNHFNNQFKRITGLTPGQYQHKYIGSASGVVV